MLDAVSDGSQTMSVASTNNLVLLVEDYADVADIIGIMLTDRGYTVKHVNSATKALDWLREGEGAPALILSDVGLPGRINGIELACIIKTEFPTIPVLLTTGYSDKADIARWIGVRVLMKPMGGDEIADAIAALIQAE